MAISIAPTFPDEYFSVAGFGDFGRRPVVEKGALNIVPQQPSPPNTSDGSPDSSAPAIGDLSAVLGDEDEDESGSEDCMSSQKRSGAGSAQQASKRGKASSAERRATHNAIERARRESLNGRFLELANALPTMANVKRPSKSVIVNKSLEWIYESQIREHALTQENSALRAELNDMRARLQMPPIVQSHGMPPASEMARYKAAGVHMGHAHDQLATPHSPGVANAFDGAFAPPASFQHSGALQHPLYYPAFAGNIIGSTPTALARNQYAVPSQPYSSDNATGPGQPSSPSSSPSSRSETGSEGGVRRNAGIGFVKVEGESPGSTHVDVKGATSAPTQADAIAALQAAHFQQQQFAAFAAAAASQAQVQGGQPAPTTTDWAFGGFLF